MPHEITIPRLGWSMEEGTFVRWLIQDGEQVRRGEPLFELEGEKASQEIEAVDEGILRIPPNAPQPGSVVKVGAIIGYLVAAGEAMPVAAISETIGPSPMIEQISGADTSDNVVRTPRRRDASASPRARRVAAEIGIDWTHLHGTGSGGRIRECDVRAAAESRAARTTAGQNERRLPIAHRRRIIAQRMMASRQQTVPVTLTTKTNATKLVEFRQQFKSADASAIIPSYQDIIVKLTAETLKRHILLAGRWEEDAVVIPTEDALHLGVAVDTPEGLLVPVIRNVGRMTLADVAAQSRELIARARAGKLTNAEMHGGVFTITNLGAQGIDAFTPVINAPETAILGLGAIRLEPVVLDDGQIVARHQITLSLTFDHRMIDGAPAARFLQDLARGIANLSEFGT